MPTDQDLPAFDHPYLAADVALLTARAGALFALLLRRAAAPFGGAWALPGGFVQIDESLDAAAGRVLQEKAGLDGVFLEQLYTFGEPRRDPRARVVTVSYYALASTPAAAGSLRGGDAMLARSTSVGRRERRTGRGARRPRQAGGSRSTTRRFWGRR